MHIPYKIIILRYGIALLAIASLSAQDGSSKYSYDAGVSVLSAVRGGVGFGPSFTAERTLTDKQRLRGTLEYVRFSGGNDSFGIGKNERLTDNLSVEADWVYSFNSNDSGIFVLGGIRAMNNTWELNLINQGGYLYSSSHSQFTHAMVVGGGIRVRGREIGYKHFIYPPGDRSILRPIGVLRLF